MGATIHYGTKVRCIRFSMRSILVTAAVIFCVSLCCTAAVTYAKDTGIVITVRNPLNIDRQNEPVVLQWNDLARMYPAPDPARIKIFEQKSQEETIHQIVDADHNGTPEELIFQSDFKAGEIKKFILKTSKKIQPPVQPLTDARFVLPREDLAWENDRIAFRIYGPALAKDVNNGIDVWTKRVRYPIVAQWYKGDEDTGVSRIPYHEDHGEGADYFSVGRTLGAGSCALYDNDSLYQPGVFATQKVLATGPLRAIFEVTYNPVRFGEKNISEVRRVTLDAGSNLNAIEITYRCESPTDAVLFAAGIVKRKGVISSLDTTDRWVSLWGPTTEKEETGSLGTGIVMMKKFFTGVKENDVHVLILGRAEPGKPLKYYTGAGWTRSGDFATTEEWNAYLKKFAQRIEAPLEVSVTIMQ